MRISGNVKWFNEERGWGFVTANKKDYFIHFSEIKTPDTGERKYLKEGQAVTFVPSQLEDGRWQANDLVPNKGGGS